MLPLYDMLAKAQDGRAAQELARQYGLSMGQTQTAIEALLPAFSRGLKQNAADPSGIGAFLSALSSGKHASYYDNPQSAFSPSGVDEGNGVLGHLFGSPEVSRAVAAEAARSTGIAQETLKRMLPALAAMIMGGLFNQASGRSSGAQANPLQEIMERMMGQGSASQAPSSSGGSDNPFLDALGGLFGGNGANASRQSPADNPFGRMFEEMMSAGKSGKEAPAQPPKGANVGQGNAYDDLFGQMFETGRKTSDDYRNSVEGVFDSFLKGMDKAGR